jgi:hypothetical protein
LFVEFTEGVAKDCGAEYLRVEEAEEEEEETEEEIRG